MRAPSIVLIGALSIGLVAASDALAAQAGRGARGGGPPPGQTGAGQNGSGVLDAAIGAAFDAAVQQTIRGYFQTNPIPAQGLPPGIARNLARGKPLPPGIAKRYLPSDLQTRLPAYPGYEILIADRNVLLVSVATGIVADILLDVL